MNPRHLDLRLWVQMKQALLAGLGVLGWASFSILLYIAWKFNDMQIEIDGLKQDAIRVATRKFSSRADEQSRPSEFEITKVLGGKGGSVVVRVTFFNGKSSIEEEYVFLGGSKKFTKIERP